MKNALIVVVILATLGSAAAAATHANPGVVGLLLALAFAAVAGWAGSAALDLRAPDDCSEPRHRPVVANGSAAPISREHVFGRLWGVALGAFALAGVVPLVSLGRRAQRVAGTAWTRGVRVVTLDGKPVHYTDLAVDGMTTVFPEGHVGANDSAALLIRVEDNVMLTNHAWAPHGNVAFSKICTHAGCPVAIYRPTDYLLYCPCHQSEFAVLFGAKPVSGPATRALPQLELGTGADGYLIARGDFSGPVGPDDWNRPV